MSNWFSGWLGRAAHGNALAQRLQSYAPYEAPHVPGEQPLTEAQAQDNFRYFERVRPARLQQLATLLKDTAGVDPGPALAAPAQHAPGLADALHHWAGTDWPALARQRPAVLGAWLRSTRRGDDIVYSMLMDVAILLGELIRGGNAHWSWGPDLDLQNLADGMVSARRIVLLAPPVGAMPRAFVLDVEDIVVHRFLHGDEPAQRLLNPLRRLVEQGIRGDAMAFWQGTAQTGAAAPSGN